MDVADAARDALVAASPALAAPDGLEPGEVHPGGVPDLADGHAPRISVIGRFTVTRFELRSPSLTTRDAHIIRSATI
jgi:hypothetical protein